MHESLGGFYGSSEDSWSVLKSLSSYLKVDIQVRRTSTRVIKITPYDTWTYFVHPKMSNGSVHGPIRTRPNISIKEIDQLPRKCYLSAFHVLYTGQVQSVYSTFHSLLERWRQTLLFDNYFTPVNCSVPSKSVSHLTTQLFHSIRYQWNFR